MPHRHETEYDVVVIGGGIVGSAIARQLASYELDVALLESRAEVGDGTSKANTAILHTGFDATPGTLESELVARGYALLSAYARQTGIPVEPTGAVLVAWTSDELDALPGLKDKAERNGYADCEIIDADAVYDLIPDLGHGALGGLTVPGESIICTWTTNLALATDAVRRGVTLLTDHRVTSVEVGPDRTTIGTSQGRIAARWVVNAAGLGAAQIDGLLGHDRFTSLPRRGELIVFDKLSRPKVPVIVLPVPTKLGKGVLISPTIYGNVMLGPTADEINDPTATGTTADGMERLFEKGRRIMPTLLDEEVTASYAGIRAATDRSDYLVEVDEEQRYVLVAGIRSTGLTAGMSIAEHVDDLLAKTDLELVPRTELPEPPAMPNIGEAALRPYQDAALIASDPAYGTIVCFCERVTAGEIRDAMAAEVPATTAEGLRRRTRVMNGRCQGFFCGAAVTCQLADQLEQKGATPC